MNCCSSNTVEEGPTEQYKLTVTTNDGYVNAGTLSHVYVKIVGDQEGNPITDWIHLIHCLRRDFRRGQTSTFFVTAKDVGKPLILEIELRKFIVESMWACDRILVEYKADEFTFPLEDFVTSDVSIARGTAHASGQVSEKVVENMRERETDNSKVRFKWIDKPTPGKIGWGLPRYVNESTILQLPNIFQWTTTRLVNLGENGFEAVTNLALDKISSLDGNFLTDLDSYTKLYKHLHDSENPVFFDCWKTDEEFGRQQLNGVSPHSFFRCSEIPENCQITEDDVRNSLQNSLADEMKAGKIYLADYSKVFQGVPRTKNGKGEDLYCPDAFCLYYVNAENNFVPLAIQLVPDDRNTVFTPADSEDEWLLAKMYFKVAFGNLHEWYYHFLLTHDVMETFGVAVFRCFPRSHPLYKLLRPHLQTIAFINSLARSTLINPTSTAYKGLAINGGDMAVHMFKDFTFDDLVIPEVLQKKGLDDATLLPKYYYRDDALKLWEIQETFVTNVINHYYKCDEDVEGDFDLQSFVMEMKFKGYGWQDRNPHGIPDLKTRTQLIRLCTTIAFTTSAQHAAVNFQQYEFYKYIPSSPLAMRLPPPRKTEIQPTTIMDSLPDLSMSTIAITIAYTLSAYSPNEVYLGNYPLKLFTELEIQEMEKQYQEALDKYSDEIKERNDGITNPAEKYDSLIRSKVPNSIAI